MGIPLADFGGFLVKHPHDQGEPMTAAMLPKKGMTVFSNIAVVKQNNTIRCGYGRKQNSRGLSIGALYMVEIWA